MAYAADLWRCFAVRQRPTRVSVLGGSLLFSSPVVIAMLVRPELATLDLLLLTLALMSGVSLLLYVLEYLRYLRVLRAPQPAAELGPAGYRITPGGWVPLLHDHYRYRMTLQPASGETHALLTLRRAARINHDRTDSWLRASFPVPDDEYAAAAAFVARFNALHKGT